MPVTLITGASTGIGNALARELARRGHAVGLLARSADKLEALAAEIAAAGGKAAFAAVDVTDRAATEAAVKELEIQLGACDVLVANAGTGIPANAAKVPVDACIQTMRLNYEGVVYSFGAVLPGMLARKRGTLVAISSIAAGRGLPGHGAYCASKAAVSQLMESFRNDLRPHGIRCVTVQPGFIQTPLTAKNRFKMPFLLTADDAARRIANEIVAGTAVYTFPWQLRFGIWLGRLFPPFLWDRIVGGRSGF